MESYEHISTISISFILFFTITQNSVNLAQSIYFNNFLYNMILTWIKLKIPGNEDVKSVVENGLKTSKSAANFNLLIRTLFNHLIIYNHHHQFHGQGYCTAQFPSHIWLENLEGYSLMHSVFWANRPGRVPPSPGQPTVDVLQLEDSPCSHTWLLIPSGEPPL